MRSSRAGRGGGGVGDVGPGSKVKRVEQRGVRWTFGAQNDGQQEQLIYNSGLLTFSSL